MNRLLKIFENIPNVRVAKTNCKKDYRRLDSPNSIFPDLWNHVNKKSALTHSFLLVKVGRVENLKIFLRRRVLRAVGEAVELKSRLSGRRRG